MTNVQISRYFKKGAEQGLTIKPGISANLGKEDNIVRIESQIALIEEMIVDLLDEIEAILKIIAMERKRAQKASDPVDRGEHLKLIEAYENIIIKDEEEITRHRYTVSKFRSYIEALRSGVSITEIIANKH